MYVFCLKFECWLNYIFSVGYSLGHKNVLVLVGMDGINYHVLVLKCLLQVPKCNSLSYARILPLIPEVFGFQKLGDWAATAV